MQDGDILIIIHSTILNESSTSEAPCSSSLIKSFVLIVTASLRYP